LLARIPEGRPSSIEREFFPGLLADRIPFYGWVSQHYWLDIGNPAKYRQAQLDLMGGRVATSLRVIQGADRRSIADDVAVDPTAAVAGPCVIGAGTRLGAGSRVGPETVLGERCVIGRDARLTGAILWDRVSVGDGAVLEDCIVGAGAQIGRGARVGPGVVVEADRVVAADERLDA
jgi:NDP-sugar pyrophosphorylase family protein